MTTNTMTTNTFDANTLISCAQSSIKRERSKINALKKFAKEINKQMRTLDKIFAANFSDTLELIEAQKPNLVKVETSMWAYYYEYADTLDLSMSGRIEGLDSLKDERLTAVLEAIETQLGVEFGASEDETWRTEPSREFTTKSRWLTLDARKKNADGDYESSPMDYIKMEMRIKISASARSDSPTCRKVQTGVKMEETPVYEIQCS